MTTQTHQSSELTQVNSKAVILSLVSCSNNSVMEATQASRAPSTRLRVPLTFTVGRFLSELQGYK